MQADVISQKFGGGNQQIIAMSPNHETQISTNDPIPIDMNTRPQTAGNANLGVTVSGNTTKQSKQIGRPKSIHNFSGGQQTATLSHYNLGGRRRSGGIGLYNRQFNTMSNYTPILN